MHLLIKEMFNPCHTFVNTVIVEQLCYRHEDSSSSVVTSNINYITHEMKAHGYSIDKVKEQVILFLQSFHT